MLIQKNNTKTKNTNMWCCKPRTTSPLKSHNPKLTKEETIIRIPNASAHLIEADNTVELAKGDLIVIRLIDQGQLLATIISIGSVRWPLTRDEPVVKIDGFHYLFSLPDGESGFLNYGVSFGGENGVDSGALDEFLKDNSCFSEAPKTSSSVKVSSNASFWRVYTPKIRDYNGVLEKAVAGGTGQVVKGIFACSDAYANLVHKGANMIQPQAVDQQNQKYLEGSATTKKASTNSINRSLKMVRKLSEMTEKMSKSLLNGVITVTGSISTPLVQSKTGKAILGSFPGTVLVASLDAVNKVLDAVEAAERKTLAATGGAVAGVVSKRFGENAGKATEDVFATAGHTVGTAWNVFKIRKAATPSSSLTSSVLKNAIRNNPKS